MSGLAAVLCAMGHQVTATDLQASPVLERLAARGVTVATGHCPDLVAGAELVTASPAVPPGDPELAEARRRGVAVWSRAEVLGAVASQRRCVAVAGTHGKTTTASMLVVALEAAGLRPSFLVGADVAGLGTNARWGPGEWLVVEADESYGSFAALRPDLAVLTNVEPDHLDHYRTLAALHEAFARFVARSARVVVCSDDPVAASLGERVGACGVGTGPAATYRMTAVETGPSGARVELAGPAGPLGTLSVPIPGHHNAANAALAAAAAMELGATFGQVATGLARFTGVPRRFERRGAARGVTFVDDYAHLPGEVAPTLAAARALGARRVVAVFQPHRYTRTEALAGELGRSLAAADVVVVTDVYGAGDPPLAGVTGRLVADAVASSDPAVAVHYAPQRGELRGLVASLLRPGDLCLTLGAGDLTTLPDELLADPSW